MPILPGADHAIVFTYGTLRRGEINHHMLYSAIYFGTARVQGKLIDTGYYFPGFVAGTDEVPGELYKVSTQLLKALDSFEGVPNLFKRVQTETLSGIPVYVYYFNAPSKGDNSDVH